ncbi:MAG: hypothetical protein P8P83_02130 [Rickettsiaceae bacterium]|nr:hypothetical protein [Rickettsiaceae bacterium]
MKQQTDKKWLNAIFISSFLHLILIGVFLFGMPSFFQKSPPEQTIITFEVLPFKDIPNVKTESKVSTKEKKAEKSKEVKKSLPKPKEQVKKETPKPPNKKNKAPSKTKTPPKQEKKKPAPKPKEDPMDALLNQLEKESQGNDLKTPTTSNSEQKASDKFARGTNYDEDSPLSITEKLAIQNQIHKHWRAPAGANNLEEIRIIIHIFLEKNGVIKDITVKDRICPGLSDVACKLVEDSAVRALKKASPLEGFILSRYDIWKEFTLEFDPSFAQ